MVLDEKAILGTKNGELVVLYEVTISDEVFNILPITVRNDFEYAKYHPTNCTRIIAMTPTVADARGYCSHARFEQEFGPGIQREMKIWQAKKQEAARAKAVPTVVEKDSGEWS